MDNVVGARRVHIEIILYARMFEIGIGFAHLEKHFVLPVPRVGVLHSVIVAVTVAQKEHGIGGIVVHADVFGPHVFRLEGAVTAATVFISLVASRGHRDDFLDGLGGRIHPLDVMRLIRPRGQDLCRGPDILELDPGAAQLGGGGVLDFSRVDPARAGARPGEIGNRAEKVAVIHDDPLQAFLHQRGNHPFRERAFRRPKTLGVLGGVPQLFVLLLVQTDLHLHRFLACERHQAVVIRDPDRVEAWIIPRCAKAVPRPIDRIVPRRARAESPEVVVVFGQRSRITHLRAPVLDALVGGGLAGILGPRRVCANPVAIPHALDAEVEATIGIDRLRRFVGVINRLMHVPEIGDMNGFRRKSRCRHTKEENQSHVVF